MSDWSAIFGPDVPIIETLVRGTIMYFALLILMRINNRNAGEVGLADVLVIVLLADAAQNGMAGESKSITEALLLISTIVAWDWIFDYLGFKSPFWKRILEPEPLLLVEDGKIIRKQLEKELMTEDDLLSQLRQQGVGDPSIVKKCYLESNGRFSVLTEMPDIRKQKGNESGSPAVN